MRRVTCALALAALAACSPDKPAPTVSRVDVAPVAPIIKTGSTATFAATAVWSDQTTTDATGLATWRSSATDVLLVSDAAGTKGKADAVKAGQATVTATVNGVSGSTDVTVADHGELVSIEVGPANAAMVPGQSSSFWAMGTYEDGAKISVGWMATWSSDDGSVATVSDATADKGKVTAQSVGTANITATIGSVTDSVAMSVIVPTTLTGFRIDPPLVTLSPGTSVPVRALAREAGGAELDVTSLVDCTWLSDDTNVVTFADGRVSGVSVGVAHVSATYSGKTAGATIVVEAAKLVALRLSSAAAESVGAGFTGEIRAFGLYSDGTERDLTEISTWTSDTPPILEVSDAMGSKGNVIAKEAGTATVTAMYGQLSETTVFTVTQRQVLWVTVDPVPSPLPVSASHQLSATAMYDDYTFEDVTLSATWSPQTGPVVSVSAIGLATMNGAGTAVATASYGGSSAQTIFTVVGDAPTGLLLRLGSAQLWQGQRTQATATLVYGDGRIWDVTEAVSLASAQPTIASIEGSYTVRAIGAGQTSIQASYAGKTQSVSVTVDAITGIYLDAAPSEIPLDAKVPLAARATTTTSTTFDVTSAAEWSSDNPNVLAVANTAPSKGIITGVTSDTATVTVRLAGFEATKTITVRKRVLSIAIAPDVTQVAVGGLVFLTATAQLEDGPLDVTSSASWARDLDVVRVFSGGRVSGSHVGTSIVSATIGGVAGYALVTVAAPLKVEIRPAAPDPIRLPASATVRLSAWVLDQDNILHEQTVGVTWTSSDPSVATFSSDPLHAGELTVSGAGSTLVKAEYAGEPSVEREVIGEVLQSVTPLSALTVPAGGSVPLELLANFSSGETSDVSPLVAWTTSDSVPADALSDVAIVDEGMLIGMRPGTATVSGTFAGTNYSTGVTVQAPSVKAVDVLAPTSLAIGVQAALQASADLSNGDRVPITGVATATTTTPSILTVNGTTITAYDVGTGTVNVDYLGASGTANVSVIASAPWLQIEPAEARMGVGTVLCPYVKTSGVPESNVTDLASYVSSDASVAQLSGACVTAEKVGSAVVTASYGQKSASMLVTVDSLPNAPRVESTSSDVPIHVFERTGYEAVIEPLTVPLTSATWASGDAGVAKVVGAGVLEGVAEGWTTATASIDGYVTPFWVRVLPATLDRIELRGQAPAAHTVRSIAVPEGVYYPLTVAASYSDGVTDVVVTESAAFSSVDEAIAAFDGAVPGVLHAKTKGVTHITAQVGTVSVTIPVTVF